MKAGPNIALIASLLGDPARANMLTALMDGRSLTASELAGEAGVTLQTASSHLAKLVAGGLVEPERQGRHRYFRLSGGDVAGVIEALMGLAARAGHLRMRTGPKDPALRHARVCYDHLAGELGVRMFDGLMRRALIGGSGEFLSPTRKGKRFFVELGIDLDAIGGARRPLCRKCLDWSQRRSHLAGALGAALLDRFYALEWARRQAGSRAVTFTRHGQSQFDRLFGARAAGG